PRGYGLPQCFAFAPDAGGRAVKTLLSNREKEWQTNKSKQQEQTAAANRLCRQPREPQGSPRRMSASSGISCTPTRALSARSRSRSRAAYRLLGWATVWAG